MENFYEILGCEPSASQETLKHAYQKLVLKYHPDKLVNQEHLSEDQRNASLEMFIRIDKAWKILSSSETRKQFDALWKQRCLVMEWPVQDTIDEEELEHDEEDNIFTYPCRCGNDYEITETDASFKVDYVSCTSCSLALKIIYKSTNSS